MSHFRGNRPLIGWLSFSGNDQFCSSSSNIANGNEFRRIDNFLLPSLFFSQFLTSGVNNVCNCGNVRTWVNVNAEARHAIAHSFIDNVLDRAIWNIMNIALRISYNSSASADSLDGSSSSHYVNNIANTILIFSDDENTR